MPSPQLDTIFQGLGAPAQPPGQSRAQGIGQMMGAFGAGIQGNLPQFQQVQNQTEQMRAQEAERQRLAAIERQKTVFTDAQAALRLAENGDYDNVVKLVLNRLQLLQQFPEANPEDTQRVGHLAIAARNGDEEAAELLKGELTSVVDMGRAIGVLQPPTPRESREVKVGDRTITQEFDQSTGQWMTIADADRFNTTPTTQVNIGPQGQEFGDPPANMAWARNEDGSIAVQLDPETGFHQPVAVPIAGGPIERAEQSDAEKAERAQEARARAGGTVIQDVGRALELVQSSPGSTTGFGAFLRQVPRTSAMEAQGHIDSALSNVGLDTLQQMRENSPTGGALGQVPIQQQKRLEQVLGSLDLRQRPEVVEDNLKRVQNIYMDIVHGSPEDILDAVEEGKLSLEDARPLLFRHELSFDEMGRSVDQEEAPLPPGWSVEIE